MTGFIWAVLGVLAGACVAIQAPVNAQLGRDLGLPVAAAGISFAAGAILLAAASVLFARVQGVSPDFRVPAPWLFVAGGVLGAVFVTSSVMLTPKLGAAAMMAFLVTGQLLAGIVLDRLGFLGLAVREITLGRVTGAMLLLLGALLIRLT